MVEALAQAESQPLPMILPEPEPEVLPQGKLSERGIEVIRSTVLLLDQNLWEDCKPLASATHYNMTIILGPSLGVGVRNTGFFAMGGLEIELGYEFWTGKFYSEVHPVKQNLTKAIGVFESHFIMGIIFKFTHRENGKLVGDGVDRAVQYPPFFSYRRSNEMLGFGAYFGLNLLSWVCIYVGATSDVKTGLGMWLLAKGTSVLSVYWTDYQVYEKITWSGIKNWGRKLFGFNPKPSEVAVMEAVEETEKVLDEDHPHLAKLAEFAPDCEGKLKKPEQKTQVLE
ncbi:MAG: hypothetical protein ACXVA9_02835 [Bdellovibrionales bacterium]